MRAIMSKTYLNTGKARLAMALMGAASLAAMAGAAQAQTAEVDNSVEAVIITGSRIVRDGFQAPTPTTVLGVEEIQRKAPINLADQINELPALAGSARNATASISGGGIGVNSLNLRNLGVTRTLILLDGQRMPAATTGGAVDVNTIPNALIKRVDIVTGGASAAWGSDAVAGVVNFVLDKDFTGFKGEASGGVTTYGDNWNYKLSAAAGAKFAGGRGHFMVSAESEYEDGIRNMDRPWYVGAKQLFNPAYTATNGQPQLLVRQHVGYTTLAPGAIVTSGPLKGLMFGQGGSTSQLATGLVSDSVMVGGDWTATDFATNSESLAPTLSRQAVFARGSFQVTEAINLYGQFSYSRAHVDIMSTPEYRSSGITIQRDNPYLPASVVAQMQAQNLTSLSVGSWNANIGPTPYETNREMFRYVVGANGEFGALGSNWNYDLFWNRNVSDIYQNTRVSMNANYTLAVDAVAGPGGAIVCRSTLTNPTNGCVPYNVLGVGTATQSSLNYILGNTMLNNKITQNEFAGSIRGEPFSVWAGPVSFAAGFERRSEKSDGTNDPLSQTNGYFYGNYKPIKGGYHVTEGFAETVIPLLKDVTLAKSLDFNGAIRVTDYSTSGTVTTWKLGGTYKPVDDLTLRITRSRDIRAGNLTDLFQPGRTANATITDPSRNNESVLAVQSTIGNTEIKPERANSLSFGGVFQPTFLPGFTASVDYWSIDVKDVIATLSAANLLNLCYVGGDSSVCGFIGRGPDGRISTITLKPINLARQKARGIDFEASYRMPLSNISSMFGDGQLMFRGLATHYTKNVTDTGIVGSVPQDTLGSATGTPRWRYRAEVTYSDGPFLGSVIARGISSGTLSPLYIECTASCPVSTVNNRTIDNNHVDGAIYVDLALSYKVTPAIETFAVVSNIANAPPAQVADTTSVGSAQWGASPLYYDLVGRTYRAGVRFKY
jgi:outer membrane receptor protein involved in Fe transport